MAGVLRRGAATAVAASIRATVPAFGSARKFSAVATPRLPAAATKTSTDRLSSATANVKNPIPIAAPLRRSHHTAIPEALEARIQRLEVDLDNKIAMLRVELQKGSVEACEKVERGVLEAHRKLEKAHLEAYATYLDGQASQDVRITNLSELITAESRRSLQRAGKSSIENARAVIQAGTVSWRVVVTVVTAAASVGFATAQLLRTGTTAEQTQIADDRVRTRIAEIREDFSRKLEQSVEMAVQVSLAKEATRKSVAVEEALQTLTARIEDVINGIDTKIDRAVEISLAKQALKTNAVGSADGGGPSNA